MDETFDIIQFCVEHPDIRVEMIVRSLPWNEETCNLFITLTDDEKRASIRKVVYIDSGFSDTAVKRIAKMYIEGCMIPQLEAL